MSPLYLALLVAILAAAGGWQKRRRAAARRETCRERFLALLAERRPELSLVEAENGSWQLRRDGDELATVDAKAVTRTVSGDEERRRRLFLAVADAAAQGPRPFAGEFDLKGHGARTLPRLADEGLPLLALEPRAVRHTAADSAGLSTIYLIDGESSPVYLTAEHLDRAGIDERDVHGVALAVLRQRFDEARARRAALDSAEVTTIEPADGCGGSRILLLPEVLRQGETAFASAPAPGRLLIAADRGTLEAALAEMHEPALPLPPAIFRVTSNGLRMES